MTHVGLFSRSVLFLLAQCLITPPFTLIALATFPFKPLTRYRVISQWSRIVVALAQAVLGIRYRVQGAGNIPNTPAVILSKHQSAWETLAFQVIFPPQVLVLKRELLRIPFFGWGLAMMSPIAVDRASGRAAITQLLAQGKERLRQGFFVVIFPEGTRVAPGARGSYRSGGALLAARSGAPVIPVAHNAGELWKKNAFIKYPGTITVSIGAPIACCGLKPAEIMHRVETWIESEMQVITGTAATYPYPNPLPRAGEGGGDKS
jgi:1-acyl-sn-glycerol-3-phosphate acyltransferase